MISSQFYYHNGIATVTTFSFSSVGGEFVTREIDFRKPKLREYTAPSSLCLCQHPPEVSHCSRNRISVSRGKGVNFITNVVFLLSKYEGNYNW